jgi:CrcB protein
MGDLDSELPVDPDRSPFDVPAPVVRERIWDVMLVIAAGGALGGALRHGLNQVIPPGAAGFPWSTFAENVLGSFLLGLLMVYLLDVWRPNRYLRPFLGVGVLGGFTTFSAYTSEIRGLLLDGAAVVAGLYLVGSLAAGLLAALAGLRLGQYLSRDIRRTA